MSNFGLMTVRYLQDFELKQTAKVFSATHIVKTARAEEVGGERI